MELLTWAGAFVYNVGMKDKCPREVTEKNGVRDILALSCEKANCKKAILNDEFVSYDCLREKIRENYQYNTKKRHKKLDNNENSRFYCLKNKTKCNKGCYSKEEMERCEAPVI